MKRAALYLRVSTLDPRRIPTERVKGGTTEVPRPPRAD